MKDFAALRRKTHSYLKNNNNDNKKSKERKKCVIKRKIISEDHKYGLEATQLENETNQLEKNKLDVDNLRENNKKFIKTII